MQQAYAPKTSHVLLQADDHLPCSLKLGPHTCTLRLGMLDVRHATAAMDLEQPDQAAAVLAHYGAPKAAEFYPFYQGIAHALLSKLLGAASGRSAMETALSACHRFLHELLLDGNGATLIYNPAKQVSPDDLEWYPRNLL